MDSQLDDTRIAQLIDKHSKCSPDFRHHIKGVALASPLGKMLWPAEHAAFIQIVRRLRTLEQKAEPA